LVSFLNSIAKATGQLKVKYPSFTEVECEALAEFVYEEVANGREALALANSFGCEEEAATVHLNKAREHFKNCEVVLQGQLKSDFFTSP
jgi:hypothetical protein